MGSALCSSCFVYRPVDLASVPVGSDIRLEVTREGLLALPEEFTPSSNVVAGRLDRVTPQDVVIRTPVARSLHGVATRSLVRNVQVDLRHVGRVDRREFSLGRTVAFLGGGAGAVWLAILAVTGEGGRDNSQPSPDPPPENTRIPLLHFSWPR